MNTEIRQQISQVLGGMGEELDITQKQYEDAVESYKAVGDWLSRDGSPLASYKPEILPQGSFLLGTMIKRVHEKDHVDIDLVCRLSGLTNGWTAYDVKMAVGDRLKDSGTYAGMLLPEGRRCWTLQYAEDRGFHMDILPSLVGENYFVLMERKFSDMEMENVRSLAIYITDNQHYNYFTSTNPLDWPLSNMFGFASWFKYRSQVTMRKSFSLNESVKPVPAFNRKKLPLQQIVQILKRHRDIMFDGDDKKPISIIITTLAALAYNGEIDILTGLQNVVTTMHNHIEHRFVPSTGKRHWCIPNPVNPTENFADKWVDCREKENNFWIWLKQVTADVAAIADQDNVPSLKKSMERPFGDNLVKSVFEQAGHATRGLRESGALYMSAGTGRLGASGRTSVPNHNNFGRRE